MTAVTATYPRHQAVHIQISVLDQLSAYKSLSHQHPHSTESNPPNALFEMSSLSSLVVTLTLALAIAANPLNVRRSPVTLPMARHVNMTGTIKLLEKDQARARHFKQSQAPKPEVNDFGLVADAVVSITPTDDFFEYVTNVSIMLSTAI